jgi:hypothetical protein
MILLFGLNLISQQLTNKHNNTYQIKVLNILIMMMMMMEMMMAKMMDDNNGVS